MVVLGGASMPLTLRRKEGLFSLVGECYIDAITSGEAIQAMESGNALHGQWAPEILREKLFNFDALEPYKKGLAIRNLHTIFKWLDTEYRKLEVHRFDIC